MTSRIRKILIFLAVFVCVITLAHVTLDYLATRRLEQVLHELDPQPRDLASPRNVPSRGIEALSAATAAFHAAFSPASDSQTRDVLSAVDSEVEAERPPLEELARLVEDGATVLSFVDAVNDAAPLSLPPTLEDKTFDLLAVLDVARLCSAAVAVQLAKGDVDGAAAAARRLSRFADAFENGPLLLHQMVRITIVNLACSTARKVIARAVHPAALAELGPKPPIGAIRFATAGEFRVVRELYGNALEIGVDALRLGTESSLPNERSTARLPLVGPWLKFGLVEYAEYLIEVRRCLETTPGDVERLKDLSSALREDGGGIAKILAIDFSVLLERETESCANVEVLRAGSQAWAAFRERGTWPPPASLGTAVQAGILTDGGFRIRSAAVQDVTWILTDPR